MRYRIVYQDYFKWIRAGIKIDKFEDWLEDLKFECLLRGNVSYD